MKDRKREIDDSEGVDEHHAVLGRDCDEESIAGLYSATVPDDGWESQVAALAYSNGSAWIVDADGGSFAYLQ